MKKRVYFTLAFIFWYIWLSIVPAVGQRELNRTLKDVIIGKITYMVTIYYVTMQGVFLDIAGMGRSP